MRQAVGSYTKYCAQLTCVSWKLLICIWRGACVVFYNFPGGAQSVLLGPALLRPFSFSDFYLVSFIMLVAVLAQQNPHETLFFFIDIYKHEKVETIVFSGCGFSCSSKDSAGPWKNTLGCSVLLAGMQEGSATCEKCWGWLCYHLSLLRGSCCCRIRDLCMAKTFQARGFAYVHETRKSLSCSSRWKSLV